MRGFRGAPAMDGAETTEEKTMRTVTVLVEGYVKAIEGRQLIPGVAAATTTIRFRASKMAGDPASNRGERSRTAQGGETSGTSSGARLRDYGG
jgi:hypothetical protein